MSIGTFYMIQVLSDRSKKKKIKMNGYLCPMDPLPGAGHINFCDQCPTDEF